MSAKEESAIRTRIADWIMAEGGHVIVTSGSIKTASGTPDIIASMWCPRSGTWAHFAIEVKTPEGTPSRLQIQVLKLMARRGYVPMLASCIADVLQVKQTYDIRYASTRDHVMSINFLSERLKDRYRLWSR